MKCVFLCENSTLECDLTTNNIPSDKLLVLVTITTPSWSRTNSGIKEEEKSFQKIPFVAHCNVVVNLECLMV